MRRLCGSRPAGRGSPARGGVERDGPTVARSAAPLAGPRNLCAPRSPHDPERAEGALVCRPRRPNLQPQRRTEAALTQYHHRTCHLCEAMCGVTVEFDGDRVLGVRGDKEDPFSQGHICPKAVGLKDLHEDPDRLRFPQRRVGTRWVRVGWDEALDEIAARLLDTQATHGRNSVAFYQGNPTVHNYGATLFGQLFSKSLGSRSRFSATSADQLPQMLAGLLMFGHQLLLPIPDIDRTDFLLVLGANPVVSNGSIMSAPGVERRLRAIQKRGGRVVVVDPRRSETAELADQHLFIRPGADALLLLAILQTLFTEKLTRPGRLLASSDGIGEIERAAAAFPPERVAQATGIDPSAIRELARAFAAAPSAACYGRVGVCTQRFGSLASWLVNALNLVTGNLDRPGGAMFTKPAFDLVGFADKIGQRGHFGKGKTRVRGLPEFGGEYPIATLAEEIEAEGPGQIRSLVCSSGNPVLSSPNGRRLDAALGKLDFMVSIDIYRNETSRHAHFILPPTSALERDHYDVVFHALAVRNTAKYSLPLFQPPAGTRHDWQILLELATRLDLRRGGPRALGARAARAVLSRLGPAGIVDAGLRLGPYRKGLMPGGNGMSIARLRRQPHGVDLGALEPCLPGRMPARGGARRIDAAPRELLADLPRLERFLDEARGGGLELIGRRELRSNNSWMHNAERLVKGPVRCTLRMHPQDAARLGLAEVARVKITSRTGELEAPLEISDEVMPGVVSLPHGWGHGREGVSMRVAEASPGVSANDITDEALLDDLSGNASFSGVPVQVSAAP
jgi:anaerobic selenocysteine-containing dehydrogenase